MLWDTDTRRIADGGGREGLACVLVQNLPSDCTEREVKNLGVFLPGFQSCEPKLKTAECTALPAADNQRPQALLWFTSLHFAHMAVDRLHEFQIDTRTRLQASVAGGGMPNRTSSFVTGAQGNDEGRLGNYNNVANGGPAPNPAIMTPHAGAYFYAPAMVMPNLPSMTSGVVPNMMPPNHQSNPPCNTLFIGNLTVGATENELEDVFSRFDGFVKVKLAQTRKGMSAFVEYNTVENAVEALQQSQNVVLKSSSGRGAIRVQYSKNPLGSRGESRMMYAPVAGVPPNVAPVPAAPVGAAPGLFFVQTPGVSFVSQASSDISNGESLGGGNDGQML